MEGFACGIVLKAQEGRALAVMTEVGRAEAVSEGPRRSAESRYMPDSSVSFRCRGSRLASRNQAISGEIGGLLHPA